MTTTIPTAAHVLKGNRPLLYWYQLTLADGAIVRIDVRNLAHLVASEEGSDAAAVLNDAAAIAACERAADGQYEYMCNDCRLAHCERLLQRAGDALGAWLQLQRQEETKYHVDA